MKTSDLQRLDLVIQVMTLLGKLDKVLTRLKLHAQIRKKLLNAIVKAVVPEQRGAAA